MAIDNVSHAAIGVGLYAAFAAATHADLHTSLASAACVAAIAGSEAPDFDYFVRVFKGPVAYLNQHRGISHSLLVSLGWALVITTALSFWVPRHFLIFFLLALLGCVVHLGIDLLTTDGAMVLWPFRKLSYSLDAMFIIDVVYLSVTLYGLIAVAWGASYGIVWMLLAIVACYTLLRVIYARWLHVRVVAEYPARRVTIVPTIIPWAFDYVADGDKKITMGHLSLAGVPQPMSEFIQADWTAEVKYAVMSSEVGKAFYGAARHFVWRLEPIGGNVRIRMADAMFRYGHTLPFSACITLSRTDQQGFVVLEEAVRGQPIDFSALMKCWKHETSVSNSVLGLHIRLPKRLHSSKGKI